MGRLATRQSVQTYLAGAQLPYVGTVYEARPTILDEDAYLETMTGEAVAASANGSACVIVVNLPSDKRVRRADTGRGSVQDSVVHDVALELFFASPAGDAVAAQTDYDQVVDALIIAIRANPVPGTVWSAGEFEPGISHAQDSPYTDADGLTILISGVVRFEAWEWEAGTGV